MFIKKVVYLLFTSKLLWGLEIDVPKAKIEVVPILEAIKSQNYDVFEKLFDKSILHKRYHLNRTLLYVASRYNNRKVAQLLITKGALLNAVSGEYQDTPLHTAIRYGYLELAVNLIKHNANFNIKDKYGETALEIAERLEYVNIIELLQIKGARLKDTTENTDIEDSEVNRYRHGSAINSYKKNFPKSFQTQIHAHKIVLRHNKIESSNEQKNSKDLGNTNSNIVVGN